uniref:Leucine-rich repeat-containing N-terminal plant-type domain-containing protein n=1 Tax=Fagus sylvatica TaxID=28930 RepID=A0A2N9J8V1_FAGSY
MLRFVASKASEWPFSGSIVCHNVTGHVQELHLRSFPPVDDDGFMSNNEWQTQLEAYEKSIFGGKINPSLLDLKHLIYLDLSYNNFNGTQIPKFLGSMKRLRYLNLSNARFGGVIPHQLGNLSNLHYLNLGDINLYVMNLQWLSGLPLLQHLDMSFVNLSQASDWLPDINKLPSLLELRMSGCYLSGSTPSTPSINFSSLVTLDLSYNHFENTSNILWVFGLHNLVSLDLSGNQFQGPIPIDLQNMTSLRHLDLSWNIFNSSIPNWLYNFSHLEFLNLYYNHLQGTISSSIENLTSAISIDLSYNELGGKVPRSLGPIPESIGNLSSLRFLYLDGILDTVPHSFWNLSSQFSYLNFSHNRIYGEIPNIPVILSTDSAVLDMSSNNFTAYLHGLDIDFQAWGFSTFAQIISMVTSQKGTRYMSVPFGSALFVIKGKQQYYMSVPFESVLLVIKGKFLEYSTTLQLVKFLKVCQDVLSHLNLSNNHLTGRIPSSTQLQSLDASSFVGNNLFGPPLCNNCTIDYVKPNTENERSKDFGGLEVDWFYVSMALGFVVGFWVV